MLKEGYFIDSDGNKYYPRPSFHIGYILESTVKIDPGKIYGGVWEEFGIGRVLVGVDETNSKMNEPGKEFGSPYLQKHSHTIPSKQSAGNVSGEPGEKANSGGTGNWASHNNETSEVGTGDEGNYQPSITAYRYVRIA